jgi:hypothetical protein
MSIPLPPALPVCFGPLLELRAVKDSHPGDDLVRRPLALFQEAVERLTRPPATYSCGLGNVNPLICMAMCIFFRHGVTFLLREAVDRRSVALVRHNVNYGKETAMKEMIVYLAKWYVSAAAFFLVADVLLQWWLTGGIQL